MCIWRDSRYEYHGAQHRQLNGFFSMQASSMDCECSKVCRFALDLTGRMPDNIAAKLERALDYSLKLYTDIGYLVSDVWNIIFLIYLVPLVMMWC